MNFETYFFQTMKRKYPTLDFSNFEYVNNKSVGVVKCPIHGEFQIRAKLLMNEVKVYGCLNCANEKIKLSVGRIFCRNNLSNDDISKLY